MTTDLKPIPERQKLIQSGEVKLLSGGHEPPPADCTHPEGCDRELAAWALGQEWTDHPDWESPVLAAFRRRLNDGLPDDLRQKLAPSMFDGIGTANDGRDEDRAWMITDWSVRVALPTWLELAGVEDAPAKLRALPEVTAESCAEARPLVCKLRDEAWERRKAWRAKLTEAARLASTQPVSESPGKGEPFEDEELDNALGKGWRRAVATAFLNLSATSRVSVLRELGCDSLQQVRARNLVAALAAKLDALPESPGNSEEATRHWIKRSNEEAARADRAEESLRELRGRFEKALEQLAGELRAFAVEFEQDKDQDRFWHNWRAAEVLRQAAQRLEVPAAGNSGGVEEELAAISLTLRNQDIEDCSPEEGVERLASRYEVALERINELDAPADAVESVATWLAKRDGWGNLAAAETFRSKRAVEEGSPRSRADDLRDEARALLAASTQPPSPQDCSCPHGGEHDSRTGTDPQCPIHGSPSPQGEVQDGWHEVWVWRDGITGKLHSTTGSSELTPIPPVDGISARLYVATGKQSPAEPQRDPENSSDLAEPQNSEPQGDVVEVLAKRNYQQRRWVEGGPPWEDAPDFKCDAFRRVARDDLAAITPLLALEIRERLEGLDRFSFQASDDEFYNGMIGDEDGPYIKRSDALAALDKEDSGA